MRATVAIAIPLLLTALNVAHANQTRIVTRGDFWVFYYRLPRGMMGGSPTVEIDTKSFKVIRSYMTQ